MNNYYDKSWCLFDINGDMVKHDRFSHPYSYDKFAIWSKDYLPTDSCVYSDRLFQWDYEKYNSCCHEIWDNEGQYFSNREPEDIEKFLSMYLDKGIILTGIEQGCNASNGFPYWIFYFRNKTNI